MITALVILIENSKWGQTKTFQIGKISPSASRLQGEDWFYVEPIDVPWFINIKALQEIKIF